MRSALYWPQLLTVFIVSTAAAAQSPWGFPLDRMFVLTSINGQTMTDKAPTLTVTHIAKENKFVGAGYGGCNNWRGQVSIGQTEFAVEYLGATKMFCTARMTDEANFFSALKAVKRWRMNGASMVLEGGQVTLTLSPAANNRL